jgi:hypothetical protein
MPTAKGAGRIIGVLVLLIAKGLPASNEVT